MGLMNKIDDRTARIGVIGLGYVGLPLVRLFHDAGYSVLGFDVDPKKIAQLREGTSYIQTIDSEEIARFLADDRFDCTTDFDRLTEPDVILICVPTPLTPEKDPDLSFVTDTAQQIGQRLRPDQLIILESTTYPGTTEEVVRPILDAAGLELGREYFLAYSPEREDPGNAVYRTQEIPKVVGGVEEVSTALAAALYGSAVDTVVPVSSTQTAEAVKIVENIYRCVNIAMVNELKILFAKMGIDVWEVISAAATKPFGFQPFYPGPGLGGHCIPIDPFYLSWKAKQYDFDIRFIQLAGQVNAGMPEYVLRIVSESLNAASKPIRGSQILVLGMAYKRDVDDLRESPALRIIDLLVQRGAQVSYHDPHIPHFAGNREYDFRMDSVPLDDATLAAADCVVIVTDHSSIDYQWVVDHAQLVIDSRGATRKLTRNQDRVVMA